MPATSEIFFDPSGRRWRHVKLATLAILALLAALFAISWGPVHAPPTLTGEGPPLPRPDLTDLTASPAIGKGPLARLVRIERRPDGPVAIDPLNGATIAPLTPAEVEAANGSRYAIYQYGYDEGVHHTISLTFDDGPDRRWTPQILDLLSRYKIPATFFVIGSEVVHNPDLVVREVREGHTIGNHTMTHPELTPATMKQEIVTADRIITATTKVRTGLIRFPFDGYGPGGHDTEGSLLLEAQRLGYIVSFEDFDSNDWRYGGATKRPGNQIPLPPATMDNMTILLHDGGGDRGPTLDYLNRLIPWALAHGYTFHSLPQVSQAVAGQSGHQAPNLWDRETLWAFQARWLLPNTVLRLLFWIAVVSVVGVGLVNLVLATGREVANRRRPKPSAQDGRAPPVTVVMAALNEGAVIGECLAAVCRSRYPGLAEIIVIDDGSSDDTADVVAAAAADDERIRLIRQPNRGKPAALNRAYVEAQNDIVVTLDADTLFTPDTIDRLVLPYLDDPDGRVGAVAGRVKVGNLRNLLTRWQALEYLMQVGVDRSAQDALHAIMVVPGACAAWRREAVMKAGGYSAQTLAEDCDLALELQRLGYRVVQSERAECYTEAPETFRELSRQRFRWTYGNAQALWKHRGMMLNVRYRWLGIFSMPAAAFAILMPLVFLPFVYLMAVLTAGENPGLMLTYAAIFLAVQFVQALGGILLSRESRTHLLIVPLYRLIAEPLRAYLLYKAALTVLRGTRSRWNKVRRTGTVQVQETAGAEVRT